MLSSRRGIARTKHDDLSRAVAIYERLESLGAHKIQPDLPAAWRTPEGEEVMSGEEQLAILEAVDGIPFNSEDPRWKRALVAFRARQTFVPWILEAMSLPQVQWRTAKRPVAYVLAVARNIRTRRIRTSSNEASLISCSGVDWRSRGLVAAHDAFIDAAAWACGEFYDDPDEFECIPDRFWFFLEGATRPVIDWDKVGHEAGLDEELVGLLWDRAGGATRESQLEEARDEEERLSIQAAWRRLNRNRELIRRVLTGAKNKNVPENRFSTRSGVEARSNVQTKPGRTPDLRASG
jgi:hypothetical protein